MKYNKSYRRLTLWLVGLGLVSLLAACGDSSPTPTPAATAAVTTVATTTAAVTTTTATTVAATTVATTTSATTVANTTLAATTAAATTSGTTGGDSTGVSANEIVIGSWGPQTGPAASYGVVDRTIAAYFKMVNDQGGINGRQIKFVYEDDAYDPTRTSTVVKKLVEQDKVFALIGGLGTANNVAVMDYLTSHNVPSLGPATGSSIMCCQPLKKNVFALQTNYTVEANIMTHYATEKLNAHKIAVLYQNDPFGNELYSAIQAVAKEKGLPDPVGVGFATTDKDFSSPALKLQQSGADTLMIETTTAPTAAILKEIDKLGWKPTILTDAADNDPSLFKTAGSTLEGAWTAGWLPDPNSDDPKVVAYRDFMKKYMPNETIGSFTVVGMAYAQLMAEALRRAGPNPTRESLIAGLETFKDWNDGLPYKVNYSATNRQGQNALYLYQAKDGKWIQQANLLEYQPKQ